MNTVLIYWCDGDVGYVTRVDKDQAAEIMRGEVKLRSIDFDLVAKQSGANADPNCIYDLINAVNYFNSKIGNPVSYYFKEIES